MGPQTKLGSSLNYASSRAEIRPGPIFLRIGSPSVDQYQIAHQAEGLIYLLQWPGLAIQTDMTFGQLELTR
jgi:hypothetical protein